MGGGDGVNCPSLLGTGKLQLELFSSSGCHT